MSTDLLSIGLGFDRWQDAVEAAIATNQLSVLGEVRGGQLIQYADASGALITIMAVEPYATYAGFESVSQTFGNVTMVNDVLAYLEVMDAKGTVFNAVTANVAQGPLLSDLPTQEWQQLGLTALCLDYRVFDSLTQFVEESGRENLYVESPGAEIVAAGDGGATPDALLRCAVRVLEAEYRHNQLTGQRFIHVTVDGPVPFDVCMPDAPVLPQRDSVIEATTLLTASVLSPVGGGCGCGGSCGCGGH